MNNSVPMNHELVPVPLDVSTLLSYLSRLKLWPSILRRYEEDCIASLVPIDSNYINCAKKDLIGSESLSDYLAKNLLTEFDLECNLHLSYALEKFSKARFGPGLEEEYLATEGGHDQVIYSLIRLDDLGLAQELWIRLEEGEATFPQLAEIYGQSPESDRKGLFGPLAIGNVHPPDLAKLLRTLKPGEIHSPVSWGDWHVLIRLERLQPTPFDHPLRKHLLDLKLSSFLDERINKRLSGQEPESLLFDSHS